MRCLISNTEEKTHRTDQRVLGVATELADKITRQNLTAAKLLSHGHTLGSTYTTTFVSNYEGDEGQ